MTDTRLNADASAPSRSTFSLASTAFGNGDAIPSRYTCDGADLSPPLEWSAAPVGTGSFALIVEDPDAPGGTFTHWVLYDLPPEVRALPEDVPRSATLSELGGARQGRTSYGEALGYGGPCPPPGPAHHYHFRLFALDAKLGLPPGTSRDALLAATRGHQLGVTELVGLYARKKR
jgi:Raf kinase inhibitor-like YbhB/YbcL family protein